MGRARDFSALRLNRWTVLVVMLALAGCSQTSGTARGVITAVEGTLDEVQSFTVLVEGSEKTFFPLENTEYTFPLAHLREHLRTGEMVLVEWETRSGVDYALALEDG